MPRGGILSASVGLPKGIDSMLTDFTVIHYGIGKHIITLSRDSLVVIHKV